MELIIEKNGRKFNLEGLKKGWELAKRNRKPENYPTCLICGKQFHRNTKQGRGKFCSIKCKAEWQKGKVLYSKPKQGIYKNCKTCGSLFYVFPSQIDRKKYCSIACRNNDPEFWDFMRGKNNYGWKGGKQILNGYVYVKSENHPFKNSGGYVAEHRLIMEKYLNRYLGPDEDVHHLNGIKNDNRIENLQIVLHKNHKVEIQCPYCNKKFLMR